MDLRLQCHFIGKEQKTYGHIQKHSKVYMGASNTWRDDIAAKQIYFNTK